ncbi:hypothetical protein LMTR13_09370 [Bradyrhizobium icense]|uniref:KaiC-like domain-containing protein n=1 Tax=Bradyrhizobium icense TaxID=1274631 RepID=A0A1B1UC61_9BRAD|nr:hypothetical protein LMTR13_09370 [Bradyrhizobium icense]
MQVFPRLVASEYRARRKSTVLGTDIAELDELMGGGIDSGSSTLIIGPAGIGKSLLVFQFIASAVRRGEHAALFAFDEELGLLFSRFKAMGIDLEGMRDNGDLLVAQVDAAEISPGELAHRVRTIVEKDNIQTVAIDSLNGYRNSMPQEKYLTLHMHELLQYLNRVGAATFLTVAQHGMVGDMKSPVDSRISPTPSFSFVTSRRSEKCDGPFPCSRNARARTKIPFVNSLSPAMASP